MLYSFNAQHMFPSDPSFLLPARFNSSIVGFRLRVSLYYFNDPLTESDWKNPTNFSGAVGDVDGHKSAAAWHTVLPWAPRGKKTASDFDLQKLGCGLSRVLSEQGMEKAPPRDGRWFPAAFLA